MYLIDENKISFINSITVEQWNDSETYALKINGEPILKGVKGNMELFMTALSIAIKPGLSYVDKDRLELAGCVLKAKDYGRKDVPAEELRKELENAMF